LNNTGKLASPLTVLTHLPPALTIEKNQWNHVAAVFDINKMSLYINGIKNCELNIPATKLNKVADNLRIGRSYQNEYFKGKIEELKNLENSSQCI